MLYATPEWRSARAARLRIDGGACVQCAARNGVSVDHGVPLRRLWTIHVLGRGSDVDAFVRAACDVEQLRTRCSSCHGTIEAQRRKAST